MRRRPVHRLSLLAFGLAALAGLLAQPADAADRALLVGIDEYRHPDVPETPGAERDVEALARVLRERFGFAPGSIRTLLGEQATADAVVEAFRTWLVEGTRPGDRVFFHYSGHGSQLQDDDGDEADGFDETLAPFDVDPREPSGAGQIRDDVIEGLVAALSGRRAVLLFDSCHSGTVTRAAPGSAPRATWVRYLPRADQMRRLEEAEGGRLRGGAGFTVTPRGEMGGDARLLDRPGSSVRLSGIVTISAARPGQLAYTLVTPRGPRGALSWMFEQTYRRPGSRGAFDGLLDTVVHQVASETVDVAEASIQGGSTSDAAAATASEIAEDIPVMVLEGVLDQGIQRLQEGGHLYGSQRPEVEVISDYPIESEALFGSWEQEPAVALSNPVAERRVTLATLDGRSIFESGESVVFRIGVDRPGWLYLLVFSAGGRATCIFPNDDDPDPRVSAGERRLPPTDASYVFPVQPPFGRDVVVALVSERPLDLCDEVVTTWQEVYRVVDLSDVQRALRRRVEERRGIGFESLGEPGEPGEAGGSGGPALEWQSAAMVIETRPGS